MAVSRLFRELNRARCITDSTIRNVQLLESVLTPNYQMSVLYLVIFLIHTSFTWIVPYRGTRHTTVDRTCRLAFIHIWWQYRDSCLQHVTPLADIADFVLM